MVVARGECKTIVKSILGFEEKRICMNDSKLFPSVYLTLAAALRP